MSNPPNLLSQYRTYSYHQFLLMCSSSAVAENIGSSLTDLSQLQHPAEDRFKIRSTVGGSYVTLVDGMSDAYLSITKSSWKTVISPNVKTKDGALANLGPMVDGLIELYEPNGAGFIDVISRSMITMGLCASTAVFAIKTVFIGHPYDSSPPVYINSIRPFTGTALDISAIFDSTGSKYRLMLMGLVGGAQKIKQQVFSGHSIQIAKKQTFKSVMDTLATLANKSYGDNLAAYNKLQQDAGEKTKTATIPHKYAIKISGKWKSDSIVMGTNEIIRIADSDGNPILNLSPNGADSITSAIETVLKSSATIMQKQKSSNAGEAIEDRFVYSITDATEVVNGIPTTTFHIGRKKVLSTPAGGDSSNMDALLTFDYQFTGKNVDIVDWDMKLKRGVALLNLLTTTNSMPDVQAATEGSNPKSTIKDTGAQSSGSVETQKSQFLPAVPNAAIHYNNQKYPVASANFYTQLSKQAEADVIETMITIHGNPTLLDEMTIGPSQMGQMGDEKNGTKLPGGPLNADWIDTPTTIRMNVKIPVNPDRLADGYKPFWFRGLYRVITVEHVFSDGKFVQNLQLFSVAGSHPGLDTGDEVINVNSVINTTTPKGVTRNPVTNKVKPIIRANSTNFSEIKEIAIRIANEEGVDPNLVLGIIKQESSFNVNAVSPIGCCFGLMQVSPIAAEEVGVSRDDLFIAEENIRAGTRYIKKQLKTNNGDVEKALIAYNAGPGRLQQYLAGDFKLKDETTDYIKKVPKWASQFEDGSSIELRKEADMAKLIAVPEIEPELPTILKSADNETAETVKAVSHTLIDNTTGKAKGVIEAGKTALSDALG